ncbi:hypothetical protein ADJ67_03350 [Eubacterium sulci ATCC 35585]|nr:hypothetical protein ADJ67_03350 [Eubacterium sulci ATCC 35585]EUC78555.1 leucine rich repeat protein [Eubacterium sulci ATCC 35585]
MCNEKFKELFSKDIYQLPIRWEGRDFYGRLYNHFKTYCEDITEILKDEVDICNDIEHICIKICTALDYSFRGYPIESYKSFKSVMDILNKIPLLVDNFEFKNEKIYRVVNNGNASLPERERIFHVPFKMRSKMSTQRYSIPGFPSLYLGTSIELCCMELDKEPKQDYLCVSRFEIEMEVDPLINSIFGNSDQPLKFDNGQLKIFDLSLKPDEIIVKDFSYDEYIKYIKWYPLLSACSYIRAMHDDPYSPEYIMPQLFTQWVRSENEETVVGIKYFSCASNYASKLGKNFVFPSTGTPYHIGNDIDDYCARLSHRFKLTQPKFIKDYKNLESLVNELNNDKELDYIRKSDKYKNTNIEGKYSIKEGVSNIGKSAFLGCDSLTEISIPKSVTYIGDQAFYECKNLKEINIPSSVNHIGNSVFFGCQTLENIFVHSFNQDYCDSNGIMYNKNKTELVYYPTGRRCKEFIIPDKIEFINATAFESNIYIENVIIPDSVENIGYGAFRNCNRLTKVVLSKMLENIEIETFCMCHNLTKIEIPSGVTSIGDYSFRKCHNLTEFEIPKDTTEIGIGAFYECKKIKKIEIPNGVTYIGDSAFYGCESLTRIVIPKSINSIDDNTFMSCTNLTEIKITDNVTSIGDGAFAYCCNLTEFKFPSSITDIGESIFYKCINLSNIIVDDSNECFKDIDGVLYNKDVTKLICYPPSRKIRDFKIPITTKVILNDAFESCGFLENIEIPNGVTYIGDSAFYGCENLIRMRIPESVKELGNNIFRGCENLIDINVDCSNQNYMDIDGVLYDKNKTRLICYPQGKKETTFDIPYDVQYIEQSAFESCDSLESVFIPDSVEGLGNNIFIGCENLIDINVDCSNQNYMDIDGVLYSKDGTHLIYYPQGKIEKNFDIPYDVQYIEHSAFESCDSLESVFIPDSVIKVKVNAFVSCKNLREVCINQNTVFSDKTFYDCSDGLEFIVRLNELGSKLK